MDGHRRGLGPALAGILVTALFAALDLVSGPDGSRASSSGVEEADVDSPAASLVEWDAGPVRLAARAVQVQASGKTFGGQAASAQLHSILTSPTFLTMEARWAENGVMMGLRFDFESDESEWWVTSVRALDGTSYGRWVIIDGPHGRTRIGEAYVGDLFLDAPGGVSLRLEQLVLEAFRPGNVPESLRACQPVIDPRHVGHVNPEDEGQPLAGVDIDSMSPLDLDGLLARMSYCHTYRLLYRVGDSATAAYSEVWCTPPDEGRNFRLEYLDDGSIVAFVLGSPRASPRPQPVAGWGCDAGRAK